MLAKLHPSAVAVLIINDCQNSAFMIAYSHSLVLLLSTRQWLCEDLKPEKTSKQISVLVFPAWEDFKLPMEEIKICGCCKGQQLSIQVVNSLPIKMYIWKISSNYCFIIYMWFSYMFLLIFTIIFLYSS